MNPTSSQSPSDEIAVRPLTETDLGDADRIFRLAFGTFLGLPDPNAFAGDADFVRTRFHANPAAAFGAYAGEALVGSNFATSWGSVGFFGPLTVRPDLWDRNIGGRLVEPVVAWFDRSSITHAGLFTFPHSTKHVRLYQKFGFWPRFLTSLMSRPVVHAESSSEWRQLSAVPLDERESVVWECAALTDAIYPGLDAAVEIRSVAAQRLGDTVLVYRGSQLRGFAVCHAGAGSEAGTGACYVKFAAVRPGDTVADDFDRLLRACEAFAAGQGASRLRTGISTARHDAYRRMLTLGFRTDAQGVTMHRPNEEGYNRPGAYVLDDWR